MSELRSAVDAFRAESLPELPDARIEDDFAELQCGVELLELERLRRLAEIERRRLFERDGHLSAASWLASTHKVAWGTAREHVRIARALEGMPLARQALDAGEISMSARACAGGGSRRRPFRVPRLSSSRPHGSTR